MISPKDYGKFFTKPRKGELAAFRSDLDVAMRRAHSRDGDGRRVLVLWRDMEKLDSAVEREFLEARLKHDGPARAQRAGGHAQPGLRQEWNPVSGEPCREASPVGADYPAPGGAWAWFRVGDYDNAAPAALPAGQKSRKIRIF
jgi:hypothetical protein